MNLATGLNDILLNIETMTNNTGGAISYDFAELMKADAQKAEKQFKDNKELKKAKYLRAESCRQVLTALTDQLKQFDFREWAGLDDGDKITQKIYVVGTIDEIIKCNIYVRFEAGEGSYIIRRRKQRQKRVF